MRKVFFKTLICALPAFWAAASLWAQAAGAHYLTEATLYISVGDSTDIWVNGQKLVSQDPILSAARGYVTVKLEGDQLCLFQKQNIMALEIENGIEDHTVQDEKDKVGIAYVLELIFSDGQRKILSSGEEGQHLLYKTDDQPGSDPAGWNTMGFDDSSWEKAQLAPPSSEIEKILHDPQTGKVAQYLYAFDVVSLKAHHGERRLFRRKFTLNIVPAPPCPQPRIIPTATPIPKPTATPVPTNTPLPRATATFTHTPRPRPTSTPTHKPVVRRPTATPTPVRRAKRIPPIPTPTVYFEPTGTPTPVRRKKFKPTPTVEIIPTPTPTEVPPQVETQPQTIVFVHPPVNILVSFKDGAGEYKVEVVDSSGNHVQTLFEKRVTYDNDTWLSWDGKNDSGALMPYGHYSANFSKDGKVLHHIALNWIPSDNE